MISAWWLLLVGPICGALGYFGAVLAFMGGRGDE